MSKVDWSLAPEGATHFIPALEDRHTDIWLNMSDSTVHSVGYTGNEHWSHSYKKESQPSIDIARAISREQSKTWSGPEDGLPPVGTVCELRTKRGGWGEAEIKYQGRRGICVWLWVRRDGNSEQVEWAESPDKLEFRATRTHAQIASEKRETAIRELMDIAQVDCRVTAARLVDAGFKREVV